MKYLLILLLLPIVAQAQKKPIPNSKLLQQFERRQEIINKQLNPSPDGRIPLNINTASVPDDSEGATCFVVKKLVVNSIDKNHFPHLFQFYLTRALKKENLTIKQKKIINYRLLNARLSQSNSAPCLTAAKIEKISINLQNLLIKNGYITSRILIPEQNLNQGILKLAIAVGKMGKLQVDKKNNKQTYADRATLYNAFPIHRGRTLNLRDLEQGLENLRRLPTVSAEMDILPSKQANTSDVEVKWQQRKIPLRLNISIDDSGSKLTGKYLGTINIAWDNPLQLNDIFSFSYTHSLLPGVKITNTRLGTKDKSKTNNYSLNYGFPMGYWYLNLGASSYHYDQVVAGVNNNYHYTGDSKSLNADISKILYRNDKHHFTAKFGMWGKCSKSFINDAEIEVQHRHIGGWKTSLSQRSYFKFGTLNSSISFKRGTRAFGAIPAPEELFNEGTGKMKIWTFNANWQMPFKIAKQSMSWNINFNRQWNKSLLTPQDKISIGGRHSVRGFSGERSLSGDRGWYLRNDLSWQYIPDHQVYLGLDAGHVSGRGTNNLPGKTLGGAVLGLKGQFKKHGQWFYDIFVGAPIYKPQGFNDEPIVAGFNFSYTY